MPRRNNDLAFAVAGGVLGAVCGAGVLAVLLATSCGFLAAMMRMGIYECSISGAILGAIFGGIGGTTGGSFRGATGRPTSAMALAISASATMVPIWFLVWGSTLDRVIILALALLGLFGGLVVGDRVARQVFPPSGDQGHVPPGGYAIAVKPEV